MKRYTRRYESGDHWLPLNDVQLRGENELYGAPIEQLALYEGLLDMEPAEAACKLRELYKYQQQIPYDQLKHASRLLKAEKDENLLCLTYPFGKKVFILNGEGFFQGKVDKLGGMVTDRDGNQVMLMIARYQVGNEIRETPALKNRLGEDMFETWEEAEEAVVRKERGNRDGKR